jgi:putative membrane protein
MQFEAWAGAAPPTPEPSFNVSAHFSWLRTRMSVERTLMSWNRTSLSLIRFGFTIYQWSELAQPGTGPHPETTRSLAVMLILVSTLGTLIALGQYLDGLHYLRGDQFKAVAARLRVPYLSLTLGVAAFSACPSGWC